MGKTLAYGQGHSAFLKYVQFIVNHENYQGMPDVYKDDDAVQWEAPSNRSGGRFQFTHDKRREWWKKKASALGIDPNRENSWISRTAKAIHPTKSKPCKSCGRILQLRYVYPNKILLRRASKLAYLGDDFELDPLEEITSLVARLVERCGARVFVDLPSLLSSATLQAPKAPPTVDAWSEWIDTVLVPSEPSFLSPGAMSNAPDRFDGFHSLNLCCRGATDPGRSKTNLQAYVTDRRVFEYWVDGNWVAAARLMGAVRSSAALKKVSCLYGHPGPCAADHIGPISLGFAHRPEFQLLCKACNSAKNARLQVTDVVHLLRAEERGETVVSRHSKALWDLRKHSVIDSETALRLSKLLRDNRHTFMHFLDRLARAGHLTFLATYLHLGVADYDVSFVNLIVAGHITRFDRLSLTPRETKYALEQKARRLRVGVESLVQYATKGSRNEFVVSDEETERLITSILRVLNDVPEEVKALDRQLSVLCSVDARPSDFKLRDLVISLATVPDNLPAFVTAREQFERIMLEVACKLSALWDDARYVRTDRFFSATGEEIDDDEFGA